MTKAEFWFGKKDQTFAKALGLCLPIQIRSMGRSQKVTLTFAGPLNLQGSQLLISNPDGSERHLPSDVDVDPCGSNATSFTPVNWGDVTASGSFVVASTYSATYQLSIPLVGDGVWNCGFRLAADDWGQAVALSVDLSGGCNEGDGCTNPNACNYDASANVDDGSCILPFSSEGCCTTSVSLIGSLGANEATSVAFEATGQPYAANAQLIWNNLNLDASYAADLVVTLTNGNGTCVQFEDGRSTGLHPSWQLAERVDIKPIGFLHHRTCHRPLRIGVGVRPVLRRHLGIGSPQRMAFLTRRRD